MQRNSTLLIALTIVLAPTGLFAADASTLERLVVQNECQSVVYRFLHHLEGEHSKCADLFTEDGQAFEHVGREKIRTHFAGIEAKEQRVNVLLSNNLLIDVRDQDHASGSCYVTHYTAQPGGQPELTNARSITRWSMQFRRVDGQWLISKMEYPESVLLRKDAIKALEQQSK